MSSLPPKKSVLPPRAPAPLVPTPAWLEGPLRSERDVLTHRRLYCAHYDRCLDRSVKEGWDCFTCTQCPLRHLASEGPGSSPYAQQRLGDRRST